MNTVPTPSGTLAEGPNGLEVQFQRTLHYAPDTVWAALTESSELSKWIGYWEGDPASGAVNFYMTAEGDQVEPETVTIRECKKPLTLMIDTSVGEGAWQLRFTLRPDGDATVLMFAQALGNDALGSVGPGWEYYLDRLVAALAGNDVNAIDWDAYFPSMSAYYESLQEQAR